MRTRPFNFKYIVILLPMPAKGRKNMLSMYESNLKDAKRLWRNEPGKVIAKVIERN